MPLVYKICALYAGFVCAARLVCAPRKCAMPLSQARAIEAQSGVMVHERPGGVGRTHMRIVARLWLLASHASDLHFSQQTLQHIAASERGAGA